MKRALAERAKQSSLPKAPKKTTAVAAHSLHQPQHPTSSSSSSSVVHSPSSPELHPPPLKIPRLHKASSSTSFQHQNSTDSNGVGVGAGAGASSSSSLPLNHQNMHLASFVTAGGHGDVGADSNTATSSGGCNQHHNETHKEETAAHDSPAGATSTKNKRPRNSIDSHHHNSSSQEKEEENEEDDEDEETKASGFYLKHQNRALATELSSLQAAVAELTAEREYRRRTCLEAVQALHSLQATWTSLEAALGQQQHPQLAPSPSTLSSPTALSALAAAATATAEQQHHDGFSSASRTPASTAGSTPETAVEWTVALHDALQALGNSSSGSMQNQLHAAAADDDSKTHNQNHHPQAQQPPPPDDPAVADLGRIAANVSSRANCLQEWIWKLLQSTPEERRRMGDDYHGANFNTDTAMNDSDDIQNAAAAESPSNKIINNNNAPLYYHWKHSCLRLETQVLELTQSRNQIAQRERKLRRNMYRLSAGMMTQQQVLQQAIHSPDGTTNEHEEFLAATAMAQAATAAAAASATTHHGTTATMTSHVGNNNFNNASDHSGRGNNSTDGLQATLSSSSLLPEKEEQGESSSLLPQHDGSSISLSLAMEHVGSSGGGGTTTAAAALTPSGEGGSGGKFMSFTALDEMKQQLDTARQEVLQGENTIQELNATLQERELRINQLTTKQLSEEDAQRLTLLEATTCKLDVANKTVTELEEKLTRLKMKWAQSAGNVQTLRESMKDMQDKHHKRWYELTSVWSTAHVISPSSTAADDSKSSSKSIINGESTASWQQHRQDESSDGEIAITSTTDAGDGDILEAAATTAEEAATLAAENQERKIMELQHKLSQALENVRQAETARNNLKTALSMNTTLQGKLDDLKHKYAAAVAAVAEQRSSSSSANPNTNNSSSRSSNNNTTDASSTPSGGGGGGSSTLRERDSSSASAAAATTSSSTHSDRAPHNQERVDKLYRDNKKMKKEITAMIASKEAHKAKIERVEKERDGLMDANARLLKQITENDEMNAKSLSTILHLKSMTEHLNAERDNLEQQVKSASQLALASRLASNAKDRVSEEMLKEKNAIHEHLTELEMSHAATKDELNRITLEWSLADGKEAAVRSELSNALQRCGELVSQVEEKRQEIRKLVAALDKAEQEARDAKKKLAESAAAAAASDNSSGAHRRMSGVAAGSGGSGGSTFTVEQLNTQISFLKGRLACPVCHYRDKQCIIMRCRHMHCKQCVDEQISNRSRKCPSCNGKFSEKDVEDVFLD